MTEPSGSFGPQPEQDRRAEKDGGDRKQPAASAVSALGRREREVLSVLREVGCATVQQVADRLNTSLAYTTVMTTLDRLFRKGLLQREKQNRAFLYSLALSAKDLEGQRAAVLIRRFFSESDAQPDVLVSCLVDAVHHYDTELLDRLESSIRDARSQSRSKKENAR
jgi:BlaI family transcriptional regulator, penicillinase repressor